MSSSGPTIESLKEKLRAYSPNADLSLLEGAFQYAQQAHHGQVRESGEDYIGHPLEVASILADIQMDLDTLCAALLHDVVEDTPVNIEAISKQFGPQVAKLVDGVTKLNKLDFKNKHEHQAENLRKMFLAMADDLRVILIKLADRVHNMRTLKFRPSLKQKVTAKETLDIYAPLAHRLGISRYQWELEDLSFRFLEPDSYREIAEKVSSRRVDRESIIGRTIVELKSHMAELAINADISGRPKHFYSIHRKMLSGRSFEEIFDLTAVRIIVDTIKDCYAVVGVVHSIWRPIPGRFKDYIAMPKPNLYQSLHTTVVGERGEPIEIQIRTFDMHRIAEYGVAAHWAYKDAVRPEKRFSDRLTWLRSILEWQQDLRDPEEFVDGLKIDLFSDEVFVFTPKGDIIDLPVGSVPLDFAYRVHTDIGHRCVGAKVNGRIVPYTYELKTGDIVEIATTKQMNGPSRDWIKLVKTPQARAKIKAWFKKEQKVENIEKGRELLAKEFKKLGVSFDEVLDERKLEAYAEGHNYLSSDDLLAAIGHGSLSALATVNKLIALYHKEKGQPEAGLISLTPLPVSKPAHSAEVKVAGLDNALIKFSRCCSPLPGDDIIGFVTRGHGVSIHTRNCSNLNSIMKEKERLIEVSWGRETMQHYPVRVEVVGMDRPGLLQEIVQILSESKTNISSMQARASKEQEAFVSFTMIVKDVLQLDRVLERLNRLRDVFTVKRVASAISKGDETNAGSGPASK